MFLHHSEVVWKGATGLILPLPHVWVQDLYLHGFPGGFQGGRSKRVIRGLLWGWGKAKPDCEVQETFPHAESSLHKRVLRLCWSCFSPAPSLPASCIHTSTFAPPGAWKMFCNFGCPCSIQPCCRSVSLQGWICHHGGILQVAWAIGTCKSQWESAKHFTLG